MHHRTMAFRPPYREKENPAGSLRLLFRFMRTYLGPHKWTVAACAILAAVDFCGSFFLIAYYLLHSLFRGKTAPMNPWGGNSLEWHTASPPPFDNFTVTPVAEDPYDYDRLVEDRVNGGFASRSYEGAGA